MAAVVVQHWEQWEAAEDERVFSIPASRATAPFGTEFWRAGDAPFPRPAL